MRNQSAQVSDNIKSQCKADCIKWIKICLWRSVSEAFMITFYATIFETGEYENWSSLKWGDSELHKDKFKTIILAAYAIQISHR